MWKEKGGHKESAKWWRAICGFERYGRCVCIKLQPKGFVPAYSRNDRGVSPSTFPGLGRPWEFHRSLNTSAMSPREAHLHYSGASRQEKAISGKSVRVPDSHLLLGIPSRAEAGRGAFSACNICNILTSFQGLWAPFCLKEVWSCSGQSCSGEKHGEETKDKVRADKAHIRKTVLKLLWMCMLETSVLWKNWWGVSAFLCYLSTDRKCFHWAVSQNYCVSLAVPVWMLCPFSLLQEKLNKWYYSPMKKCCNIRILWKKVDLG